MNKTRLAELAPTDSSTADGRNPAVDRLRAFVTLLGRGSELSDAQMTSFAKFAMSLTYPPNPIANLDNTLTPSQQAGLTAYMKANTTFVGSCNSCHNFDVTKNQFGTAGLMSTEGGGIDALEWESPRSKEGARARDWLRTKANSIEGGTSEVMLGVVAKRILDLPGA